MRVCATPATWNEGGCNVVPRLPRKMARRHRAPKPHPSAPPHAMSATPATQNDGRCEIVPRLPREIKVDVRLCHACHVKRRWMSGCATPAVCEVSVKLLYYCMWSLCVKLVWDYCMLNYCMLSLCVCEIIVCKLVWDYCMLNYCMLSLCVWNYCMLNYCMLSLCVWS